MQTRTTLVQKTIKNRPCVMDITQGLSVFDYLVHIAGCCRLVVLGVVACCLIWTGLCCKVACVLTVGQCDNTVRCREVFVFQIFLCNIHNIFPCQRWRMFCIVYRKRNLFVIAPPGSCAVVRCKADKPVVTSVGVPVLPTASIRLGPPTFAAVPRLPTIT